jgi:polygalacturonase
LRRLRADVLAPVLLKMVGCTQVVVSNVRFINSPFYHIVSISCTRLLLEGLFIQASLLVLVSLLRPHKACSAL